MLRSKATTKKEEDVEAARRQLLVDNSIAGLLAPIQSI